MLTCIKNSLLGFVLLLGFSGLTVAILSGFFLYRLHEFSLLTPPSVDGPPASLLSLGVLTLALAWFIWHFDYSSRSQIISIAGLILLVGLMEAGVGIWALVRSQQLYTLPEKVVQKAELAIFDPKFQDTWDNMHRTMTCCGVNGARVDFTLRHQPRPWTCCYDDETANSKCERGCLAPMTQRAQETFIFAFLLSLGSVILKTMAVGLAWCYAKMLKEIMVKRRREITMENKLAKQAAEAAMARSASRSDHGASFSLVEKSPMRI